MSDVVLLRLHGVVSGRVQGVGFRYFTQETANELGITGWVKNTYDGNVEIVAEGTQEQLDIFQRRISRGSSSAYVSGFSVKELPTTGEFTSFRVKF